MKQEMSTGYYFSNFCLTVQKGINLCKPSKAAQNSVIQLLMFRLFVTIAPTIIFFPFKYILRLFVGPAM